MGIVENTLSPNSAFPSISYLNAYLDLSFPLIAAAVIARSLAGALMEDARKMAHVSEAHLGGDCADRHIRILQQIDRLCDAVCDQVLVDRFAGMLISSLAFQNSGFGYCIFSFLAIILCPPLCGCV